MNTKKIDWPVVLGIGLMHLGCISAPFFFSWSGLIVCAFLLWFIADFGINICYHRLLTHHSFKTPKWFKYVLTTIGCLAWQGGPIQWVGVHRLHHKYTDQPGDPHSPRDGFAWAHVLWLLLKGQGMSSGTGSVNAQDLYRDRGIRFLNKWFWVPQFLLAGILFLLGHFLFAAGISWFIWGICVRTVIVYHVTWLVNSATHKWGYRNYETKDDSTNLWWIGILGMGEGWHNNHHHNQRSAAHGHKWWEFDLTYLTIKCLSWIGLAKDIVPR